MDVDVVMIGRLQCVVPSIVRKQTKEYVTKRARVCHYTTRIQYRYHFLGTLLRVALYAHGCEGRRGRVGR